MNVFNVLLNETSGFFNTIASIFVECFSAFELKDAFDIILLTVFLFLTFRFIRGRKAGVLLIGILIFGIVLAVTFFFNLSATYFIFSQIFKVGVIAIIIIFQPEIRDALEKIGSGSISGFLAFGDQKKRQLYLNSIDNICTAVNDLASTKTGALIVLSRNTKLDDIIETGIFINANVNSYLLRNLFFNRAPLHDGAVVIDEGRIAAAGCLLPLTKRTDVDGDLGTRHRAAIGMSESSDAIVIVVSEETGTISIAHDCELLRDFTASSLRKYLLKKLVGPGDNIEV